MYVAPGIKAKEKVPGNTKYREEVCSVKVTVDAQHGEIEAVH